MYLQPHRIFSRQQVRLEPIPLVNPCLVCVDMPCESLQTRHVVLFTCGTWLWWLRHVTTTRSTYTRHVTYVWTCVAVSNPGQPLLGIKCHFVSFWLDGNTGRATPSRTVAGWLSRCRAFHWLNLDVLQTAAIPATCGW
jgi:hypothetical protein